MNAIFDVSENIQPFLYSLLSFKKYSKSGVYKCYTELVHVPKGNAFVMDLEVNNC